MKGYVLKVEGMRCEMCEAHVNDAVRKVGGVSYVNANHGNGEVRIACDDDKKAEDYVSAIASQGYKVLAVNEAKVTKKLFAYHFETEAK